MKRLQYRKRGDESVEEFIQQNTERETIGECMEASFVLSLKGRGKKMAWPATEVLLYYGCSVGGAVKQYFVKCRFC